MKVSIIGVGAVGGFIAVKLKCAGIPVQLVFKEMSQNHISINLKIVGNIEAYANFDDIVTNVAEINGEVIFICTKSTANDVVFSQLAQLKNKTIVMIQNGIGEEEKLLSLIHKSNVIIGAISHIKVSKHANVITWHNHLSNLNYAFCTNCENTHIEYVLKYIFDEVIKEKSVLDLRFQKLLISASCNGVSVISQQDMPSMAKDIKTVKIITDVGNEVIEVAKAYNVFLSTDKINNLIHALTRSEYRGAYFSMWYDYNEGKPMELGSIYHNFIEMAKKKNIKVPVTQVIYQQLERLEKLIIPVDGVIKLRLLRPCDAESLHQLKLYNQNHLQMWFEWANVLMQLQDAVDFIYFTHQGFLEQKSLILGIFIENKLIGIVSFNSIHQQTKSAEIGYWLAQDYLGLGIMTKSVKALIDYGFHAFDLLDVSISCAVENKRSQKVAKRLGFQFDMLLPNHQQVSGNRYDHILYKLNLH
ncbi:GNAT family N-acetyltransferase [Fastidiosibacter lacustris]|uniref:GNAT family N-acetyltransferase n=1 Tax=Fastidiosibacter lacustris TaxID=2056695 RepID=UPI000E352E2D|nr:GNAT family N-acetyltransferase [Fastidiosibacter lacustris]